MKTEIGGSDQIGGAFYIPTYGGSQEVGRPIDYTEFV